MSSAHVHHFCQLALFVYMFIIAPEAHAQTLAKQKPFNNTVSAIFVFGDSTVDPGNNNYIATPFKGNFLPYGRDFANQNPTGRFSNGRLAGDFIASYVGIKEYVPPYLDPTLGIEELMSGVNFASAGSGFDPLTPRISNVIPVSKQLEYFKEYRARLEVLIGNQRTKILIKNTFYLVSAGTNDFVINYFAMPIRRNSYTLPSYMEFLLQQVQQFMQGLWDQGAQKFAFVGLPPMGCLPIVITFNSDSPIQQRGCFEFSSSTATTYNLMLENQLNAMQFRLAKFEAQIVYMDVYGPLSDIIQDHKYDFDEVSSGCCGTGLMEASFLCNPKSFECTNASKYVFWDSIHPAERTYYILFETVRSKLNFIILD